MPSTVSGTLNAVYTGMARSKYAQKSGNLAIPANVLSYVATFKVGLGGWDATSQPRTPDASLVDLDIIVDQTRPAIDKRYPLITPANGYTNYYYSDNVGSVLLAPGTTNVLLVNCAIGTADYNSDGVGNPQIWEVGLFDTDGMMLVYGTFNGITKDGSKQVELPIYMVF